MVHVKQGRCGLSEASALSHVRLLGFEHHAALWDSDAQKHTYCMYTQIEIRERGASQTLTLAHTRKSSTEDD